MAEHLSDEEQLQALKNWWKDNGTSLVSAILIGLIAYFGFQWWQNNQRQQAEQASAVYSQLLEVVEVTVDQPLSDDQKATAAFLIKQLQDDYSSSQYAINASLFAAKVAVESGDLAGAEEALTWALENANDNMKTLTKLRLARVYLASEKLDEALSLFDEESAESEAFTSLIDELKGDIFLAKGDISAARAAYVKAQESMGDAPSFRQRLLPIKIANLPVSGEK